MRKLCVVLFPAMLLIASCASSNGGSSNLDGRPAGGPDRQPPSVEEIFKMDTNGDSLLSRSEIKGPLLNDFDKVDTNRDGFISREELKNAPKPGRMPRR